MRQTKRSQVFHGGHHPRSRPHVLVVDTDQIVRLMLAGALKAFGIEVEVTASGVDALERVRERRPSVIIVAAVLPSMDAIEFVEACRRVPGNRETPIVITASTDELLKARMPLHALGGVAVLTEPLQLDAIYSVVLPLARRTRG